MKFSASMINNWMKCPLQAKFGSVIGLPQIQNGAASFGVCVHKALEHFNLTGDKDAAVEYFLYYWENPEVLGVEPEIWPRRTSWTGYKEKGIDMIYSYAESVEWQHRTVIGVEHRFCVEMGEHLISGIVDLLEFQNNTLKVVDFKAQPLDSKILTPTGWKRFGDLKTGDEITTSDGGVAVVEGIYPQGYLPAFKVIFNDGSSTICSDEHLWKIRDVYPTKDKPKLRVEKLKNLGQLQRRTNNRYFIPLAEPQEYPEKDFIIHPYLMGVLLSEGGLSNGGIKISTTESFILDKIKEVLPHGIEVSSVGKLNKDWHLVDRSGRSNRLISELKRYNLWGKKSAEKFIPYEYMEGSIEQRKELLAGLVDGDGCSSKRTTYSTVSSDLKDGFVELCRSLGGSPFTKLYPSYYKKDGVRFDCAPHWLISIRVPFNPFTLPRKSTKWKKPKETLDRAIKEVKPLNFNIQMQCIKTSAKDGLYITDDFIVTHNTNSSMPNFDNLYLNIQMTIYYYASLQKEFWTGYDDGSGKYVGFENGEELWEKFKQKKRQVIWHQLSKNRELNCGKRDDKDFLRLYRCMQEISKAVEHDVFVPCISGDTCTFCSFTDVCYAYISPNESGKALTA